MYIHIFIYVITYIYIHVCFCVCMCLRLRLLVCMSACTYVCMYMKKYFLCEGALQIRAPLEGGFLVVPEKILMSKVTYLNVRSNAGGPCKIRVGVVGGNLVETTKQLYFVHLFFFGIVSPNRLPTRKTVRRARRAAGEQRGANMGRMEWTGTAIMGGGFRGEK